MDDSDSTTASVSSFIVNDDPLATIEVEDQHHFWQVNHKKYPFSSIYRTRNSMRIKWAIVFNVYRYDPVHPYLRDLEIYPYVKGNRKFVDQRIYSHNGLPIPPELEDIIEYFYNSRSIPLNSVRNFLSVITKKITSTGYTIPERVVFAKKKALFYIVPLLHYTQLCYDDFYLGDPERPRTWWTYLSNNQLPQHSTFSECVDSCLLLACEVLPAL